MLTLRTRLNPTLDPRARSLDRWLSDFLDDGQWAAPRRVPATAGTDIYETNEHLVFEIELPGVARGDVKVRLEDDTLIVSGEVRRAAAEDAKVYSAGRRQGTFERRYNLPEGLVNGDAKKLAAQLEHGVLTVRLPLSEEVKPVAFDIEVK